MKRITKEVLPHKPSTLLERLGDVVYWASCIFAVGGFLYFYTAEEAMQYDVATRVVAAVVCAFLIWLFGLAVRYVLAGRAW